MRPFKLHVKTTLIVSAVVVAIFSIVAYVYTVFAIRLEHRQYEERALQLATYVADRYALRGAAFRGESQSELLQGYGFDLTLQQWYRFSTPVNGVVEVESTGVVPGSSGPERALTPDEVQKLVARDFPTPELVEHTDGRFSVFAVAPVIVNDRIREYVVGAIGVRLDIPASKSLAWQMTRLTIAAMALIVLSIAVTTYLLFKRLVYDPVDTLLTGMARAERGDLTVEVPLRAEDEIGLLTTRFNHMVDRLRENAEERAERARQLEERVRDATGELAEINTQLVQKNDTLFRMQRQLGEMERLATAGQLAAQFAHEVGTPLNLISGHVQILASKETDERTRKRLDTIASQISRIERIVRTMLDQTRQRAPRLERLDLGALLAHFFDTIMPSLAARRVSLDSHIEEDLPMILADGDQLQQVFINLVNNSLDAMPDGGRLTVTAVRVDESVHVEFMDTGHGINEADLPHVFEPLYTTRSEGGGNGLGLAVSQKIVREHSGSIVAGNLSEGGAKFTIILPVPDPPIERDEPVSEGVGADDSHQ